MDTVEETLVDAVELWKRSVEAAEKSQLMAGLDIYDDEGNFIEHIDFKRDPEPSRAELRKAEERLDTYRKGLV